MRRSLVVLWASILWTSPAWAGDDDDDRDRGERHEDGDDDDRDRGERHEDRDDDEDEDAEDLLIRPIALLQAWATVWDQDVSTIADSATYGDPEVDPGFELYRARAGVEGTIPGPDGVGKDNNVYFKLWFGVSPAYDFPTATLNGQSTAVELSDAYADWIVHTGLGESQIGAGLGTLPFDREQLISSEDLLFQERSVGAEWLGETRDTGAWASQSVDFGDKKKPPRIELTAGVFNGSGGDIFGNQTPGLLEVGRLEFAMGDAYRTWDPKGKTALGVAIAGTNDDDPATATQTWGTDLLARVWYVCLLAEYGAREIGPGNTTEVDTDVFVPTDRRGAMAQLSFFVPIHDESGVEIGGRYALFDDDTATDSAGDVGIIHAGATWRSALPGLDLGAGFVHRAEKSAFAFDNDSMRLWMQVRPRYRLED